MTPHLTVAGRRVDPMWIVIVGLLLLLLVTFDQSYVGRVDLIDSLRASCAQSNQTIRRELHLAPRDCDRAYPVASPWPQF